MNPARVLLAELKAAGISLRIVDDRVRITAPRGAATASLRQRIRNCKADLLQMYKDDKARSVLGKTVEHDLHDLAKLLATAFQRHQRVGQVPEEPANGLAVSPDVSAHGVG